MSNVLEQSFPPATGGMNKAVESQLIADDEAYELHDIRLNIPGRAERRGPITALGSYQSSATCEVLNVARALNPNGRYYTGVIGRQATTVGGAVTAEAAVMFVFDDAGTQVGAVQISSIASSLSDVRYVDCKPAINGGTIIGIGQTLGTMNFTTNGPDTVGLWRGAFGGNVTGSGANTVATTTGSKAVVCAGADFTTLLSPGMFLEVAGRPPVLIQSVSAAALVLAEPAYFTDAASNNWAGYCVCPFKPLVSKGLVTVGLAQTAVQGAGTKFTRMITGTVGNYMLFRQRDHLYVGTLASIQNDYGLTLAAGATVAMQNEPYIIVDTVNKVASTLFISNNPYATTNPRPGWQNTVHAGRQFYGNNASTPDADGEFNTRWWVSDASHPFAVDFSLGDGDWDSLPGQAGRTAPLVTTQSGTSSVVFMQENAVHAIVGQSPETFQQRKIADDGALSSRASTTWRGNVIWAGRQGVYLWDGRTVESLSEVRLGSFYRALVKNFESISAAASAFTGRLYANVYRDHLFLYLDGIDPQQLPFGLPNFPRRHTLVLNLNTGAWSRWNNLSLVAVSGDVGFINWLAPIDVAGRGNNQYTAIDMKALFDSTGRDSRWYMGRQYDYRNTLMSSFWNNATVPWNNDGSGLNDIWVVANTLADPGSAGWALSGNSMNGTGASLPVKRRVETTAIYDSVTTMIVSAVAPTSSTVARLFARWVDSNNNIELRWTTVAGTSGRLEIYSTVGGVTTTTLGTSKSTLLPVNGSSYPLTLTVSGTLITGEVWLNGSDPVAANSPGTFASQGPGDRLEATATMVAPGVVAVGPATGSPAHLMTSVNSFLLLPTPYALVETKSFTMGEPLQKKLFKAFLMSYETDQVMGSSYTSGVGPNQTTVQSAQTWPIANTTKRIKFLQRNQYFRVQIYDGINLATKSTYMRIYNWAIAFKWMRPGRV